MRSVISVVIIFFYFTTEITEITERTERVLYVHQRIQIDSNSNFNLKKNAAVLQALSQKLHHSEFDE